MLAPAGLDGTEVTVKDVPMGVHGHAEAEVAGAVVAVPVEPGPVIEVRIRSRRLRERLRCLMNREIVETIEH